LPARRVDPVVVAEKDMNPVHYPIIGWASLSESLTRPDVFLNIARSGINVFMTAGAQGAEQDDPALIHHQLNLAREAGITALVCDRRVRQGSDERSLRAAIEEYAADDDVVFGYYVRDEPRAHDFPAVAQTVEWLNRQAPNKVAYVNSYGFGCRGGDSLLDYAERYAREIRPAFLSFDVYPISKIPSKDASHYAIDCGFEVPELGAYYRDVYWESWETFHRVGWKYGLPLWGFALSTPHEHALWRYGPVTEGTLRLEVFTGLAYAVQATQYFTLPTIAGPATSSGIWDHGILDSAGAPSKRYDAVRRVNEDLKVLGPILRTLTCTGVYYTGGNLTSGCRRFITLREERRDSTHRPVTRLEGDGAIIGFLRGAGDERFVLLVNRSPVHEAKMQITLDEGWTASEISKRDAARMPIGHLPVRLELAPGDGRLLRLQHDA
jgi:hypothetical protein